MTKAAKSLIMGLQRPAFLALIGSVISAALVAIPLGVAYGDIVGPAFVQENGSLRVKNQMIRLYGIYIPPTERTCRPFIHPVPCNPRAALALDFKIQGFVRCVEKGQNADGSIDAQCWVNYNRFTEGEDLSAYLISQGWAAALPEAPYEYSVLEKIARQRGLGVWGFTVDSITSSP